MNQYHTENSANSNQPSWERDVLSKIAMAAVVEQRRTRRWGIFFKLIFLLYILVTTIAFFTARSGLDLFSETEGDGHVAVVSVEGVIASGKDASAGKIVSGLRAAFKEDDAKGVILRINSPGGSPVQSGLIYDEMLRLREKHPDKPLYAVIADVCASGGYYIAAAAEEIYADKASIVGSIGVRADSFGFVDAMQKLGVERRLYTSGENKALLDPFSPEQPQEVAHMESLLGEVHQQFISAVKEGRGERLQDHPDLFSGLVWTGEQSVAMGLIDGLGGIRYVAEELIGSEKLVDYTPRSSWLDRLLTRFGMGIGEGVSSVFDTSITLR